MDQIQDKFHDPKMKYGIMIGLMIIISHMNIGTMYFYDIPETLGDSILTHFNIKEVAIEYSYIISSLASLLGISLAFIIISYGKTGPAALAIGPCIFVTVLLITIATHFKFYFIFCILRASFGLYSSIMIICQLLACSYWFSGMALTFSYGVIQMVNCLSEASSLWLTGIIYDSTKNVTITIAFAGVFCFVSAFSALLYFFAQSALGSNLSFFK